MFRKTQAATKWMHTVVAGACREHVCHCSSVYRHKHASRGHACRLPIAVAIAIARANVVVAIQVAVVVASLHRHSSSG